MEYKWKVFSATSVAILMAAIDSTVVLLAFYPIDKNLHSDFVTIVWVILAYLLITTTFGLTLGRLGDLYGRKVMFNTGFAVFTVGSLVCGLSQTGLELVLARCLQGFGAALVTANAFAILSEAFPARERGKAFGANSVIWGGGSILGIVLGGIIISVTSWRWIFFINLPIGVFGTYWAYRTIRPPTPRAADAPRPYFDLPGAVTFTLGIMALLLGVSAGLLYTWPWYSYASIALTPLFLGLFVLWEVRYSQDPLFHAEFFRNSIFTSSVAAAFLQSLAIFSVNFLLLFYFEGISGVPVLTAALLVVPMAVFAAGVGPFAGIWSDRIGPRYLSIGGLAIQAAVLFFFTRLTTTTPLLEVAALEAAYGVGGGLFWPSNTSTIMSSSPPGKFGVGSGIMNTFRNTGMVLSFAVSLTAITAAIPAYEFYPLFIGNYSTGFSSAEAADYLHGESLAFTISLLLLVVALALVIWKAPGKPAAASWAAKPGGAGGPTATGSWKPEGARGDASPPVAATPATSRTEPAGSSGGK